jgi:lipopolysaccharide transport system permease protein
MRSPIATVTRSLGTNWEFARAMSARDLSTLNKGSLLGLGWLIARPLIQLSAYVLIVSYLFGVRLAPGAGPFDYALHVLSGLISWQMLQRNLEDSTSLVRDRMEILKQVVYPVETLPVSAFLTSLPAPAVSLLLYLLLALIGGRMAWSMLLLPLPIALLAMFLIGMAWVLMIVGVVFRDLRDVIGAMLGIMVYFSPVLVSEHIVGPTIWKLILVLNPLSHIVISFRDVLEGEFHPISWIVFAAIAMLAYAAGAWTVNRTKVYINEYL